MNTSSNKFFKDVADQRAELLRRIKNVKLTVLEDQDSSDVSNDRPGVIRNLWDTFDNLWNAFSNFSLSDEDDTPPERSPLSP